MATGGYWGGRAEDLFRRVVLDLVRGAVASASERTYLRYFGQFVKNRTEVVKRPAFFIQNPGPNVNVWQLVDCGANPFRCWTFSRRPSMAIFRPMSFFTLWQARSS